MTLILKRGRGVRKSAQSVFSDAMDAEVLRLSTTDRKLVAARLGVGRSVVDKAIENERRPWVTVARLWIAANIEAGSPDALAPLTYLSDCFADALAEGKTRGEREDLVRESADAMASFGVLVRELSAAIRDGKISDSEREALERAIRKHETQLAELRREAAAANENWRARRAG